MGYLVVMVVAPLLGPVLYRVLHDHPRAVHIVDGFVYVAVPALVLWQVLAHAWADATVLPALLLVAGFLVPNGLERLSQRLASQTDNLALIVGLFGLVIHTLLEGAAFVPGAEATPRVFAVAVILHRVPVGLVVWWLLRPRFGLWVATAGIASIVLGTLGGYGLGMEFLGGASPAGLESFQAFVGGSLVHVVFHQGREDHDHGPGHDHRH